MGLLRYDALAALICAALCGACGDDGVSVPSASQPLGEPLPPVAAQLKGRTRPRDPAMQQWQSRLDPVADGWPDEAWAEEQERALAREFTRLWNPVLPLEDVSQVLDSLSGHSLQPQVRTQGDLQLRLHRAQASATPVDLRTWCAQVRSEAPAVQPRVELELERVERTDTGRVGSGWLRAVWDPSQTGASRRQVSVWFDWRCGDEVDARVHVQAQRMDQVDAPYSAAFMDLTTALLPVSTHADLALGELERAGTRDRLAGDSWLAMCGAALADFDGDGLEDLYVARTGGLPNWLFKRLPSGGFAEVGRESGVAFLDPCTGVCAADCDGDGFTDLVVATGNALLLCWNDGRGRFPRITPLSTEVSGPEIYSVVAADPDKDGDVDLYATRYVAGGVNGGVPTPYHDARNGAPNVYWRNEGGRRFVDGKAAAGLATQDDRFSLAALFEDLDDDGDVDLYVTNDFGRNNCWVNDGAGLFTDAADDRSGADQAASMGVSAADVDLDGDLDVHVTNMHSAAGGRAAQDARFMANTPMLRPDYMRHARGNTLLLNEGGGLYRDASVEAGITRGGWGWGALFVDFDADGWPDVQAPAGFITNRKPVDVQGLFWRGVVAASPTRAHERNPQYESGWAYLREATSAQGGYSWNAAERDYSYMNLGGGVFVEVAGVLGLDDVGDGRALLHCDLDDDGGQDLILLSRTAPVVRLWRNPRSNPHALSIELRDRVTAGATVFVQTNRRALRATVHAGEGYLSSSSQRLLFALTPDEELVQCEVRWSDGVREAIAFAPALPARRWIVRRGLGKAEAHPRSVVPVPAPSLSTDATSAQSPVLPTRTVLLDPFPLDALKLVGDAPQQLRVICVVGAGDALSKRVRTELARVVRSPVVEYVSGTQKPFDGLLEVLLMELYGPFDTLDLPLCLVVDAANRLQVVHRGALNLAQVSADLDALQTLPPDRRAAEVLLQGTLVREVRRDLAACAQVCDLLGLQDWSRSLRETLRARARR